MTTPRMSLLYVLLLLSLSAPAAASTECEVFLKLAFKQNTGLLAPDVRTEDICIKRAGQSIKIPDSIQLYFGETSFASRFDTFCYGHRKDALSGSAPASVAAPVEPFPTVKGITARTTCSWNAHYNNRYPFDIFIWTGNKEPLAQYIKLIRVLRNGKLAFTWNGIERPEWSLYIQGSWLTAHNLPHLADFGLRITGQGVQIPNEIINAKAVPRLTEWQVQAGRLKLALDASLTTVAPNSKKRWECVKWHAKAVEEAARFLGGALGSQSADEVQRRVDEQKPASLGAADCPAPNLQLANLKPLSKIYAEFKNSTAEDLQNLAREQIKKLSTATKIDLLPLVNTLRDELVKLPATDKARQAIEQLDAVATHALGLTDQLIAATLEIRESVVNLGKDPAQQAQLVANVAEVLEKEAPVFEPRVANPPPLSGEQELHMEYGDRHQYFLLTPWNLVSFRLTQNPGTSPGWENLIPAIDLVGYRFQWAKSRFADLRIGLGIFLAKDTLPAMAEMGQMTNKDVYNFAMEVNIGLGGIKFGAGYLLSNNAGSMPLEQADRFRLLIGADLIKLITGRNLEVL